MRPRGIRDAQTLLRLVLGWAVAGKSLAQAAAWATTEGLADVTDEALVRRFKNCGPWLDAMVAAWLERRREVIGPAGGPGGAPASGAGRRLRILDGTTVSPPGATKPVWRVLVGFDPDRQQTLSASVVPAAAGELGACATARAGETVLADRNFARPETLAALADRGADFVIRLGVRSLRLLDGASRPVDVAALCRAAGPEGVDMPVRIAHGRRTDWPPRPARLVIRPLPAGAAARNRSRQARTGQREGYTPSPAVLETAGCLMLVTSLPATAVDAVALEAIYRLRWQVELAFKRLKSLHNLKKLPARSAALAQTWLSANLLIALVAEDFAHEVLDSPPPLDPEATPRPVSLWRLLAEITHRIVAEILGRSALKPFLRRVWPNLRHLVDPPRRRQRQVRLSLC